MTRASGNVRPVLVAALLATALAACGLFPAEPPTVEGPPIDCVNVPQEPCDAAVNDAGDQAAAQNAMLVQIRVLCTGPTGCTNEAGELFYEAVLSNGQTISGGSGWASGARPGQAEPAEPAVPGGGAGPQPVVQPICIGVPPERCRALAEADFGGDPSDVVSVVVRCTGTCTTSSGEGSTVVTLRNGSRPEFGWRYEGPMP